MCIVCFCCSLLVKRHVSNIGVFVSMLCVLFVFMSFYCLLVVKHSLPVHSLPDRFHVDYGAI